MAKTAGNLLENVTRFEAHLTHENPIQVFYHVRKAGWSLYDVHSCCEMGVVLSGSLRRIYPNQSVLLGRGGVWWHGPWEAHGCDCLVPKTEMIVIVCLPSVLRHVPGGLPAAISPYLPFIRHDIRARLQPRTPQAKQHALEQAKALLAEYSEKRPDWEIAVALDLLRLLVDLMRGHRFKDHPPDDPQNRGAHILTVLDYVRENMGSKITLSDAARCASLGRTSFAALFKQVMGVSFARYLRNCRLEGARTDIQRGDQKLSEIANRWGFFDSSHLVKEYRRQFGTTPGGHEPKRL